MTILSVIHLREIWNQAWFKLGANSERLDIFEQLLTRYSEPHRFYHTLQHLSECFIQAPKVADQMDYSAEVIMALWFHDAIYDPFRSDNEEKSAKLARNLLTSAHIPVDQIQRIENLILATQHHQENTSKDSQFLVDIDLTILGTDVARFREYEQQIRQEYHFVASEIFQQKRREILQSFWSRPRIYQTDFFYNIYEKQARINLQLVQK